MNIDSRYIPLFHTSYTFDPTIKVNDEIPVTSTSPLNRLLEKVKDLIPTPLQKEKEKKNEKEKSPAKLAEKMERGSSKCPHYFGYLADRSKSTPVPEECLTCQKMLECINKSSLT